MDIDIQNGFLLWLKIRNRKKIMSETGLIMISIDENEHAQLRLLCDEILGENNYISTYHIQVRYAEKAWLKISF